LFLVCLGLIGTGEVKGWSYFGFKASEVLSIFATILGHF